MNKSKQFIITYKVVLIAVFAALACAATCIQIPLPTGDMVHLGNFVCILSALLCGGLIGGFSGSIGMGIYDLMFYSAYPSTIVRTFIMKFIMGFVAGALFRYVLHKKKNSRGILYGIGIVFIAIFVASLIIYIKDDGYISATIGEASSVSKKFTVLIPIASAIFGSLMIAAGFFSKKLPPIQRAVLLSTSIAIIVNIVGEFVFKIPLTMLIDDLNFEGSLVKSITSIPSTVLTGLVTVIIITIVYQPIYNAVKDINHLDDIDELNGEESEE